jgi:glucose/arabinose dehydrogenase
MRRLMFGALLLAACQPSADDAASAAPTDAKSPAASLETQPANAPNQRPALAGQTRAPLAKSNVAFEVETVVSGLEKPWAVDFLRGGRFIVTEKPGRLRVITADGKLLPPVAGVPEVDARGQGGLLDVTTRHEGAGTTICFTYAEPRGGNKNGTAAACAEAVGNSNIALNGLRTVFRQKPDWESRGHYGSRLLFGPDGKMWITLGERQNPEPRQLAQSLDATFGKVVRLEPNGMSAPDNPFYQKNAAGSPRSQIWSYGHRNIQSAAFNPRTGKLWTVEHGPKGGDELNIPKAGRNYGWPVITYGLDYSGEPVGEGLTAKSGMEQPVYYWDPVIAPSGMAFYTGNPFPAWKGSVFIGGLGSKRLVRLALDGDRVVGEEWFDMDARIRDVAQGPDGLLYLLDETNGRLLRLRPKR